MANILRVLAIAVFAGLGLAQFASAALITFEDLPGNNAPLLGQYSGLTWGGATNTWTTSSSADLDPGFGGTLTHSGLIYAWTATPVFISLGGGATFDLDSLWVRGRTTETQTTATFQAFRDGLLIGSQTLSFGSTYTELALNFDNITLFRIVDLSNNVLVDDITATINPPRTVPEPATLALVGLALLAAACCRRKRTVER